MASVAMATNNSNNVQSGTEMDDLEDEDKGKIHNEVLDSNATY